MEELRAALEADGVDEQREEDRLDAGVDGHAQLADHHAHQQRARDTSEREAAELQATDEVAQRDGEKEREQRLGREQAVQEFHGAFGWPGAMGRSRPRARQMRDGSELPRTRDRRLCVVARVSTSRR